MDFETAVRERLPILSILFNNFSMAIELPIMQVATEKYRSTDISGNYADMARAFGGYGERITDPSEIRAAIDRGIAATATTSALLWLSLLCPPGLLSTTTRFAVTPDTMGPVPPLPYSSLNPTGA